MAIKTFELTLVVSANDSITEQEMLERFEAMTNKTPRAIYQETFQGDCALTALRVQEIKEASISYVNSMPSQTPRRPEG